MVQFLLFVLSLFRFVVSVRNRNPLLDVYFQDPRSKVLWRIRSRNSLQKFEGVTYCTRGVFFYLSPLLNILHFALELRDVGFQCHDVGLDLLWNVATLDPNVATSFFVLLWNVATLDLNVATLVLITLWNNATLGFNVATLTTFLSGTSRRCIRTSRRWSCLRPTTPSFCSYFLFPPCLNPFAPIVVPAGIHPHRRPLFFPLITSSILLPPFLHYHSTVLVSLLPNPALVSLIRIGLDRSCQV